MYIKKEEAKKEKEAKDKGEDYKSKFINKPVEEAEVIIGKQKKWTNWNSKLDFQKHLLDLWIKKMKNSQCSIIEVIFENVADIEKEQI